MKTQTELLERPGQVLGQVKDIFRRWRPKPELRKSNSKSGRPFPICSHTVTPPLQDIFSSDGFVLARGRHRQLGPQSWMLRDFPFANDAAIIVPMPYDTPDGSLSREPILIWQSQDPIEFASYKLGRLPDDLFYSLERSESWQEKMAKLNREFSALLRPHPDTVGGRLRA